MFVKPEENLTLARKLWNGKPSGGIMWGLDANRQHLLKASGQAGYSELPDFKQKELGCLLWGNVIMPFKMVDDFTETVTKTRGDETIIEYRSPAGTLTETRRDNQIIEHKVKNGDDLRILIRMWENIDVEPDKQKYENSRVKFEDRVPLVLSAGQSSVVQHMLQRETGVADFWFLLMDEAGLLEKAMEVWQRNLTRKYQIMQDFPANGWYQAENTSTTMISPEYYEKYSLEHMRNFTAAAGKAGCRTLVHMCGLLYDLMPFLKQTRMNGIHALSPEPVGNTPFDYAYEIMENDFFALGRFGSLEWIGRSRTEILKNLARILPHHIYREHAFMLLVTSDEAEFTLDNLYLLRDCINEYEQNSI